jgi:very-short-patch-repair endonuclease
MAAAGAQIQQSIERLRQKLLDLTTMNRMLSFKHPKASCLRVIDELPHQVFAGLVDGATFTFEPIPEPSRRELEAYQAPRPDEVPRAGARVEPTRPDAATWARHLGINVNYDLPVETDSFEREERHSDKKIQALHYPDELDARLRKIRASGRTAIEESGANMLYLAFGFLEWRDQQTSKAHQAPLVLLPVELEREPTRAGGYRTKIRWTGEEIQPNLSLKKKLEELNVALPEFDPERSLEDFLRNVSKAIRNKTDWTVRRYLTLGLFEFGKILLYLDLDPDRWPSHAPLASNKLVQAVLGGAGPSDSDGGRNDPDLSEKAAAFRDLDLEVVDRSDSSQCEALEVALSGKNLVIQGPPGTGKSQTITNLVAAAMSRGKTILFVAEKLAALEVVRRRMRELGLGDFCLELHSHKTRKTEMLEDIADRIRAGAKMRAPRDFEGALNRLFNRRVKLSAYIELISGPAAGFAGMTISEALMKAGQARRKLGDQVREVEGLRKSFNVPADLSWATFADAKGRIRQFEKAIQELGTESSALSHVWSGVSSSKVLPHDVEEIGRLATNWADCIDDLVERIHDPRFEGMSLAEIAGADAVLAEITTDRDDWIFAENATAYVEAALAITLSRSASSAKVVAAILEGAIAAPLESLSSRNAHVLAEGARGAMAHHMERAARLQNEQAELGTAFRSSAFEVDPDDLEEWQAALAQPGFFAPFGRRWRTAKAALDGLLRPGKFNAKASEKAELASQLRTHILSVNEARSDETIRLISSVVDGEINIASLMPIAEWADEIRSKLSSKHAPKVLNASQAQLESLRGFHDAATISSLHRIANSGVTGSANSFWQLSVSRACRGPVSDLAMAAGDPDDWNSLLATASSCSNAAQLALDAETAFIEATDLDLDYWFGSHDRPSLEGVSSQARRAALHVEALKAWLEFDRASRTSFQEIEGVLAVAGADGLVPPQHLPTALDFLVFDGIARKAFSASPDLLSASRKSLGSLREEYATLDAEVMELRRALIASKLVQSRPPEGRSSPRKSELTEMQLLRAEMAKQKRHVPIRQLVARAGKAIQVLKPCFMMGPLSVAQYLAPGSLKFDLVIMDEASQMRPEDALGALARGGQAVIVGDTKQLPPTSFFDRISDSSGDDDDEDATLAEDAKSILELAEATFTPRMLRWHYRSRHESLIAFSNKHFYKNDLIVFPSPSGQSGRLGVGWNFVGDGAATGGVNPAEARSVAAAAARLLLEERSRSVGVVAMNIKQAQRISDELAALAGKNPALADALNAAENDNRGEPFFVKNLENVQGDERDVIIISMTYGAPSPGGRVPQNFGPITMETGWRRLNVLFTRAKERMEVFSSMRSSDILPKEGSDRGSRSLKLFLDYAETGRLGTEAKPSDRDPDNDFEDAVIEGLRELNFDCVPQLGVANFFLDIAIRDPAAINDFVAAIECDGASYHSSKSARDRDRLRQEILENLGWKIIRIWSTDWFRDPSGELLRVSTELNGLIAASELQRVSGHSQTKPDVPAPLEMISSDAEVLASERRPFARHGISVDQARAELVDLRERVIKPAFPDADPTRGLLRKTMLDELLRKRPTDQEEFLVEIPMQLRTGTDSAQLKMFGEAVFTVLEKITGRAI